MMPCLATCYRITWIRYAGFLFPNNMLQPGPWLLHEAFDWLHGCSDVIHDCTTLPLLASFGWWVVQLADVVMLCCSLVAQEYQQKHEYKISFVSAPAHA